MTAKSSAENPYSSSTDDDIRGDMWARMIQMGLGNQMPVDLPLRDMQASALHIALNKIVDLRNELHTAQNDVRNLTMDKDRLGTDLNHANSKIRAICERVDTICDVILNQNVTHGQKNGMVILLKALVREWERLSNVNYDIPF